VVFVDGQNLFHAARIAFGYNHPNYDVAGLAHRLCRQTRWRLVQARFYTGVPDRADNEFWHRFWEGKLRAIGRQGVNVYSRPLRYRVHEVRLPDGRIKLASAFPSSPMSRNRRGIDKTDWIRIDRATYEACVDPHDYRR
jgi:hypothetical protein